MADIRDIDFKNYKILTLLLVDLHAKDFHLLAINTKRISEIT